MGIHTMIICSRSDIIGGGELSLIDLACGLNKFDGHVTVLTPGPGEISLRLGKYGICVKFVDMPGPKDAGPFRWGKGVVQLVRQIRQFAPEIVHADGARAMLYAGPASRLAGFPCVWHVRVLERDPVLDRLRALCASHIIANSASVASSIQPYASKTEISVVYNGFRNTKCHIRAGMDLRKNFSIEPNAFVILMVGRISEEKGHIDLFHAIALMHNRNANVHCVVAGKDVSGHKETEMRLRKIVDTLGIRDRVTFAGHIDDIVPFMKEADVLAVPSRKESFGRVIVEGWIAGVPVVATDSGGPKELIHDRKDGLLVPPANPKALAGAMSQVLADPSFARSLVNLGYIRAREFSLNRHVANVTAVYHKIDGKRKRSKGNEMGQFQGKSRR